MSNVAIIPARGGSKRIPRKNIKLFHGQPMIAYSIRAALGAGVFERVVVSTDDLEIAELARTLGAEVPFVRPPELADDYAGTTAVIQHALQTLNADGYYPALACCLYATAPFVQAVSLREGLAILQAQPTKAFAFSVTDYGFPVQRALRLNAQQCIEPLYPEYSQTRSQDLEPIYHDAGQFYWGHAAAWLEGKALFAAHSLPVVLPRYGVQDIDTADDWRRAELMFASLQMDS